MIMNITDKIYEVGTLPSLGCVPRKMYAWTLRSERLGDLVTAFRTEIVNTPLPGKYEVLVAVVSAGINYNGVWAAKGTPVDVVSTNGNFCAPPEEFHICGSEAAGIVYAVGENVSNVSVGDMVIISGARYDQSCELIKSGIEPEYSPSFHIWGYESNWGAFAQFTRVFDFQCIKLEDHMNWDEAASLGATAVPINRMLRHWKGNEVKNGDAVLVWGGAGGLGSTAIQQCRAYGAVPVAVVSDDERGRYCMKLGAEGYIKRTDYDHWGDIPQNTAEYRHWLKGAVRFRNEFYAILGKRKNPSVVIEHPGRV